MITMEKIDLNDYGYDYRFYLKGGKTVGYLKRDQFGYCELYYGDTPSTAYANNEVMLYGDTPSSIKKSLEIEFEYTDYRC